MRTKLMIGALMGVAAIASTPVFAAETMTAEVCQPLSSTNLDGCFSSAEWRDIILPDEYRYCPPLNSTDNDSGRVGEAIAQTKVPGVDPVTTGPEVPGTDPVTTGSTGGNPGNTMAVGGAGEKEMDNEDPSTGDAGNSN